MADTPVIHLCLCPFSEGADGSRDLLQQAARHHTGLPEHLFREVAVNPWGKPFFPLLPQLHFSVSHSGAWWLCAFSQQPVGADLQIHKAQADLAQLSRRFFHPLEDHWLAQEGYVSFFPLWCAKESWVKYKGRGFYLDPGTFSLVSPQGQFPVSPQEEDPVRFLFPSFRPGYSLCLCCRQAARVEWTAP